MRRPSVRKRRRGRYWFFTQCRLERPLPGSTGHTPRLPAFLRSYFPTPPRRHFAYSLPTCWLPVRHPYAPTSQRPPRPTVTPARVEPLPVACRAASLQRAFGRARCLIACVHTFLLSYGRACSLRGVLPSLPTLLLRCPLTYALRCVVAGCTTALPAYIRPSART